MTTSITSSESSGEDLIATFDHQDTAQAAQRHDRVEAMVASKCPVHRVDTHGGFWLVAHYKECQEVALDQKIFSNFIGSIPPEHAGNSGTPNPPITLDPPEHMKFRKLMLPSFTPRTVGKWEPRVREFTVGLVTEIVGKHQIDAAGGYSRRVPVRFMTEMLGVSVEDEELYIHLVHRMIDMGSADPADARLASEELRAYLSDIIKRKAAEAESRSEPADDLISLLLAAEVDGDRLTLDDVLGAAQLMIIAGVDTTYSVLASALWHLAQHPEDRHRLIAEPDLMPIAVEEFLRFFAPAVTARIITEDTTFAGTPMVKDDQIMICLQAASRDPEVFHDPEKFIIDRATNPHAAFGLGPHRCIAASVARMELAVGLEEWLRQIPDFELDGDGGVVWSVGALWGPRRLLLKW
jgi:cytochrome P450